MWKMIRPENAIEQMVVTVRFSEPLSSLVSKRIIRELERSTSNVGLTNRQAVQGFQLNMQAAGQNFVPVAMPGMLFQSTSVFRVNDEVVNQISQQVEFQPTHLAYSTWTYKSWDKERETLTRLLLPAIETAVQSITIGAVRLQYLDRFVFDGDKAAVQARDLLNDETDLIAPNIFTAPDLYHSHTGRFDNVTSRSRRLSQVNVDSQDMLSDGQPDALAGRRTISLLTALEDQFLESGKEFSSEEVAGFLSSQLDDLHVHALALSKRVINNKFAQEHRLPHE
ncbi:hypothetical protein HFO97_01215 [Rhizobium leguminosarum]|uniref:hypothetical protein n=1 Tax=Rhizobium leguminosarum TaxID=384 RepID=UPI001C95AD0D|nr:hypothetical protein [Rhizobium leguminosarum]MBY5358636.1 hypothetical protein [Rhizobium leguminosarum]